MKFLEVVRYELDYRLRSFSTWVCAAFMIALGILWVMDAVTADPVAVHANAPYEIALAAALWGMEALVVSAALFGDAAVRDIEARMEPLVFTSPLTKLDYLGGRYVATVILNAALLLFIPLGIVLSITILYPDHAHFGPIRVADFLEPWLVIQVPNLALMGAVLMSAGAFSRRLVPVFFTGVGLFLAFIASANPSWTTLGIDLLCLGVLGPITDGWSVVEKNTRLIGFPAALLWNRALWLAVTGGVLFVLHRFFRFAHREGVGTEPVVIAQVQAPARSVRLIATKSFDIRATCAQILAVARNSLREAVTNLWFIALLTACLIASMMLAANVGGSPFDTSIWPATSLVVQQLVTMLVPVIGALTTIFAGELVWKDRDVGVAEIGDATPVPNVAALGGRFVALLAIVPMFLVLAMLGSILIQFSEGYFDVEPTVYLRMLFGLGFVNVALAGALALAIHVVVNHRYLGHIAALIAFGYFAFGGVLLPHDLLAYGRDPDWAWSNMNGFGAFLWPLVWFKLYWASWALLLLVIGCVLWVRGREHGLAHRTRHARARIRTPVIRTVTVAVVLISALGGFIFYNTVLKAAPSAEQANVRLANYEKRYARFTDIPQPTIESATLRIELHPERRAIDLAGTYHLVNRTNAPIESVHMYSRPDIETRSAAFDRSATAVLVDHEVGYRIFQLAAPLAPGDSMQLSFEAGFQPRRFFDTTGQTDIVANGTYLERGWLPFIGYQPAFQLSNASARKRFGLAPAQPLAAPENIAARGRRYEIRNEDHVRVDATVGTSADQTAITAGVLRRQWTENARRYFQYEMEAPQSFTVAVFSARYDIHNDRWRDSSGREIALSVYHHPGHDRNLDTFVRSMKASLDYYTREFGPYGPSVFRIVETIPREGLAARSRNNTVILAENNFFTRQKKGQVDQLFFATAHEIAHQWWGGQIRGAAGVRGSQAFISETLANYSALMVIEQEYGQEAARRLLAFQNDRYFAGRAANSNEVPLLEASTQPYIVYLKGLLAMYLVREYVGTAAVNTALHRFFDKHRAGSGPYPTALDVYAELRAVTPDSLHSLLSDLFETVTIWDNRTERATVEPTSSGEYRVTIEVVAKKLRRGTNGKQGEVSMDDLIDVGVFARDGEALYLRQHRIRSGQQTISVTVPKEPARAGIDPHHKLIEYAARNNVVALPPVRAR
jgi:ABC-2 type transport system permease protein